jgi:diguanylate cyclase (GGDEF)-like protein/PAS domain S-box-containing protein
MHHKTKALSKNKNSVETANEKTQPSNKFLLSKKSKRTTTTKTGIKDSASLRKTADKNFNKETAARYRSMIESIDNGYFEVDLAGNFTFFNNEVCRALGYSRKELMGQNYRQHTDKETANKVFQVYNKVYKTGKPVKEFGYNIIRKDGSKRYIESSVSLRKNSSGKPIGFLGISNDFTHRKQLEGALQKSEALYRLLADHMKDQIWLMDLKLKLKYISPSVEKLLGYTLKELNKIHLNNLLTQASFQKAMDIFSMEINKASTTPPPPSLKNILELECRCKDGRTLWIEATHSFIQDKDGKPLSILGEGRDITERKRVEDALTDSEVRYRRLFESAKDGILILDGDTGIIVDINPFLIELLGYSRNHLIGKAVWELGSFKDIIPNRNKFLELQSQGYIRYEDLPLETINRQLANVEFVSNVYVVDHTKVIQCNIRDITERRNTEELLRQSEEKYRTILQNIQEGYFEVDLAGNFTFFNDSLCQLYGYSKQKLMGMNNRQYTDKETAKRVFKAFNKVYKTGEPLKRFDWMVTRKDGTKRYVESSVSLLKDSSDKPIGFRGILRDITEQKIIEEKLFFEEQRFRAYAEHSLDIIVIMNREGIITYINPAVEKVLGYKAEQRIGAKGFELVHPDDVKFLTDSFNTLLSDTNSPVIQGEMRLRHKDGSWRAVEAVGSNLVHDNVVEAIIVNYHDITERKQAEEAVRESENRYRELSIVDDLTQLYNSRHFYIQLKKETERSNRHEHPLTLLMLDIDKFKDFNDTYGHLEGDYVLSKIGQVVKRCLREIDTAYRYGGEEFTIMLPMTTREEGIVTAKRIQTELKKEAFSPVRGPKVYMTMSIGLAQYKPKEDVKKFIHRADQLMYKGKKNGRDKICCDDGSLL